MVLTHLDDKGAARMVDVSEKAATVRVAVAEAYITLMLSSVSVALEAQGTEQVKITATCKLTGQTGVEMEALTAASVAALTLYDMCKAVDKGMIIGQIRLLQKTGGKSGDWQV